MRTKKLATPQKNISSITMLTIPFSKADPASANSEQANESKKLPDPSKTVRFELVIDNPAFREPVLVIHYGNYHEGDPTRLGFQNYIPVEQNGNHYFFDLGESQEIQYFSIRITEKLAARKQRSYLLQYYHFEPGDHIIIKQHGFESTANGVELSFTGQGAAKYQCNYEIKNSLLYFPLPDLEENINYEIEQAHLTAISQTKLGIIEKYSPLLSVDSYQLLKLDTICRAEREIIAVFQERIGLALKNQNLKDHTVLSTLSAAYLNRRKAELQIEVTDSLKYKSREYAWYMVSSYVCDYLVAYRHINYMGVYYQIMQTADSNLRDRMIIVFFNLYYRDFRSYYLPLADHALTHIQNTECLEMFVFQQHRSRCHI